METTTTNGALPKTNGLHKSAHAIDSYLSHSQPISQTAQKLLAKEQQYSVGAFSPVPVFFTSGHGSTLVDADGKEYIDFITMFSAANMGQCHPKIVEAINKTSARVTLINLATHSVEWPNFAEMMCKRFGYDKITAGTSGSEAVDTACKIARKWGVKVKSIPARDVLVLGVSDNYHGLTSGVWPLMDDADGKRDDYAVNSTNLLNTNPGNGQLLRYGHIEDMEACLAEHHSRVAAVIIEALHGKLPTTAREIAYSSSLRTLCHRYSILFIADEIRMGTAKTGRFHSSDHLTTSGHLPPDLLLLGKSITGGAYPASFVLGRDETMGLVGTYEVASTFAMTPMAIATATAALEIIDDEDLLSKATTIGEKWDARTASWPEKYPFIDFVRSTGADFNVKLNNHYQHRGLTARTIGEMCMQRGLLTYAMDNKEGGRLRMGVAMTITDEEWERGMGILEEVVDEVNRRL